MSKPVAEIVEKTLHDIKTILLQKKKKPLTRDEAYNIIKSCIDHAFEEVDSENRKALYKKLSLAFHSDKLATAEPELFAYLKTYNLQDELQAIINSYNRPNFLEEAAADPVTGTKKFFEYLLQFSGGMFSAYKRYPQPISTLVNVVSWLINIALVLTAVVLFIPVIAIAITIKIANAIATQFISLFTNEQYSVEEKEYRSQLDITEVATKALFGVYRVMIAYQLKAANQENEAQRVEKFSDEEMRDYIEQIKLNQKIQEQVNLGRELSSDQIEAMKLEIKNELTNEIEDVAQSTKDSITVTGIQKLKLVAKAIYNDLTSPLPESMLGTMGAIIGRAVKLVITAPIMLGATVIIEAARYANTVFSLGIIIGAFGLKLASLAVLNAPLYALDLARWMVNGIANALSKCCNPSEEVKETENKNKHKKDQGKETSPLLLLQGTASSKSQQEPQDHHSGQQKGSNPSFWSNAPVNTPQQPSVVPVEGSAPTY